MNIIAIEIYKLKYNNEVKIQFSSAKKLLVIATMAIFRVVIASFLYFVIVFRLQRRCRPQ